MVRAYILIETETDKVREVLATVGHNLPNCKALAESIVRGKMVAFLYCNDFDAMNKPINALQKGGEK